MSRENLLAALRDDAHLWQDFDAICSFVGRQAGTPGCDAAFAFVADRLAALGPVRNAPTRYHGWSRDAVRLTTPDGTEVPCLPLVGSASSAGDVLLDVLDLARGTPEQIAAAGDAVRGRAVLLEHEYVFADDTIHRRVKLGAAVAAGAAAVVMVQPIPGIGPVSGGASGCSVPGFGVGIEGARQMIAAGSARFLLRGQHHVATTSNLILELPGRGPGWVVLSAHLDGHAPGESAIDNGSGVAGLLALARAAAPLLASAEHGLMVCVFGAEEWSLSGSRAWLGALPEAAKARMVANVNLDSIVGSPNLTALTSGFPKLAEEVGLAGAPITVRDALMVNSDHANFAAHGVPALRLIAGFNEPQSNVSRLLTAADTRALVSPPELLQGTECAGAVLWSLLSLPAAGAAALRHGAQDARPAVAALAPLPV